ncbi:uncharacterized protein [Amphiura filiformis]|uniref:uncharacterized protein n=1 Tax=Amphiura filiformis TaxID=82378 RepID=UPI003B21FF2A
MKILNINFQSVKNKKEELGNLIDSVDPSIIIGTETWLNSSVYSSEIFPPSYEVIRKDRKDGYGGVLLAIRKDYVFDRIETVEDVESVFVKLTLDKNTALIVGSLYRPPNNNLEYLEKMCSQIEEIATKFRNAVVWISGDLNLPDINWTTLTIDGHQYPLSLNQRFLDLHSDIGLEQMVLFPTRRDNTLDLFSTNRPSLVSRCTALPALGDHELVFVESSVTPKRRKPVPHKIFLWKNANIDNMKEECLVFQNQFTTKYTTSSPIQPMWADIKTCLLNILDRGVPSKVATTRYNQPWITKQVKRLTRQKTRSFNKARHSKKPKDFERYKVLKTTCRSACKKAYNDYVTNIISPESSSNPKRFWSFINSKKCDNAGVSPLKASNGISYSDSTTKANILNDQFSSVFNMNEDETTIKDKGSSPHSVMDPIIIHPDGIHKLLAGLQIHKACGPDEIPTRLLKVLADELTPVISLFFQASLNQGAPRDHPRRLEESQCCASFQKR